MKYIKRVFLILFLVIMISGCSVDYKLKINKDLSLNEKTTVSENTNRMKSRTNLNVDQSVKYLYDIYKLDGMADGNYSITSSDATTTVLVNNSYKSIEDFVDRFKTDITYKTFYYKEKDYIHFQIDQVIPIDSKASNRPVYDDITFSLEVPFEVIDNNADKISGNTYIWYIKADSPRLKSIRIEFKPNKYKNKVSLLFGKDKEGNNKSVSFGYEYIILAGIIIIIGVIILFIYVKNKKNNKI